MRTKPTFAIFLLTACTFLLLLAPRVFAQTSSAVSRITQPVDETKLTALRGNTHPLARAEFDRGAAPASLAMNHLLLVLKRSPEQEAALEKLMAEQQNPSSPNYRKWLTPQQFGQQFGPSAQDVQSVTSWLRSHGFQVGQVSNGRTVIDFSGTAGQVQQAFHTTIHRYVYANGEQHWANASDPQIPAALAPVVVGVNKLNDFHPRPKNRIIGTFKKSMTTGKVSAVSPKFTYPGSCYASDSTNCYAVGPYDFDTIYNVPATINGSPGGTGQTIAIVSDSDVYDPDVTNFRSLLGLPPLPNPGNIATRIIPTGLTNPGVQACSVNQDEEEAVLDVEWAGAAAPGAMLDLVISPSSQNCSGAANASGYTNGWDYSAYWVVDNDLAKILSDSYGDCELALGTTENAFYNTEWQQAAAEGITVLVAAGDSGSAGCDYYDYTSTNNIQPAGYGLAVDGAASTPYNVAVGGTDFNYANFNNPSAYWSSTNTTSGSTTTKSALKYIPEMVWDDSCTNSVVYLGQISGLPNDGNAAADCNNATLQGDGYYIFGPVGGSGGASSCTTSSGPVPADCSGGYPKPAWQVGTGVPADGARDIPDVSLFGSAGVVSGTAYIVCEEDLNPTALPCSLTDVYNTQNGPEFYFQAEGGTSVSAQAFAGIVALMNQEQKANGLGNINPLLYTLAAEQSGASCNASSPASTCIFNDVTVGTNAMPCANPSPNCTVVGSNPIGVLTGYNAGTGYDLATGLGSVNVTNLVNNSGPNFYMSSSNPAITFPSTGGPGTLTVELAAVNGLPTSTMINFTFSGLPANVSCTAASVALSAGSAVANCTYTPSGAMLNPAARPKGFGPWTTNGLITVGFVFCIALVVLRFGAGQRRWSTALAMAAFALLIVCSACGGGSGNSSGGGGGGGGGGGPSVTTATITGTASAAPGSPAYPLNFTVTIQ